jgi:hypothetical protein
MLVKADDVWFVDAQQLVIFGYKSVALSDFECTVLYLLWTAS